MNLCKVLNFMFCLKTDTIQCAFNKEFQTIDHIYPKRYSQNNFLQSLINTNKQNMRYLPLDQVSGITYCKQIIKYNIRSSFQRKKIKKLLLGLENEIQYFW